MRYDDPLRPRSPEGNPLQVSGAALPAVTLIAPASALAGGESPGWLACVHVQRAPGRFGYHTAVLEDLNAFSERYLQDPEGALAAYFQYLGPEETPARARRGEAAPASAPAIANLWED